ncbi:hypothetical protein SFUMM280S_11526 [Streptomyces fumanus]
MCEFMPIGPGRYRAETAEMSSKLSGFIMRSRERMGPPSNWKTPRVSPRWSSSKVVGSSSGRLRRSMSIPLLAFTILTASSMIVRLRRPRKSIFSRPSDSQLG